MSPSVEAPGRSLHARVLGLLVVLCALRGVRLAPRTATGGRRLLARLAALLGALVGILHVAGAEGWAPLPVGVLAGYAPVCAWSAAAFVGLAALWVWWTSPAIRG